MDSQKTTLGELCTLVAGQLVGDADLPIDGAAPLYEHRERAISLLDADSLPEWVNPKNLTALVVRKPLEGLSCGQIVAEHPHQAFATIVKSFLPAEAADEVGVAATANVDSTASLGPDCLISPGVTIGRHVTVGARCRLMPGVVVMDHAYLGDDCVLYPNVTLYERTRLGSRVLIHAGAVLGAFGFGYQVSDGRHLRTAQLGYVEIGDDVELGAGVTIDRGTYGSTRIGCGTKIDNQVMIGHNCQIGKHNLICSQVGIAGSCQTGDYVVLAGQVGLKDHIRLGDGAIVGAQAGVMDDLAGGQVYLGSPATTQREQMQIMAVQRRLPELRRSVKSLERWAAESRAAEGKQKVA